MNRCALISAAWRCTVSECFSFCLTLCTRDGLDMTGVFRGFFCDLIPLTIRLRLILPPGLIVPPSGQTPEPTPYPPTPPPGTPYPLGGRPTAYPPYCTLASRPECRPSLQGDLRRLHEAGSSGSAATHPYDTPLPATTTPLSRVAVCGVWQTQGRRQTLPPLPPTPSPTPTLADRHPTLPTPPPTPYPPPGRV